MAKPLVFISHSSKDKEFARGLAHALRKRNVDVWLDQERIHFGDSIPAKISEGLASSDVVLILVSSNFIKSSWCRAEYEPILSKEINDDRVYVIPVRLDDSELPPMLSAKLYVDFTQGIDEDRIQRLCNEIWNAYSTRRAQQLALPNFGMFGFPRGSSVDLILSSVLSDYPVQRLAKESLEPQKSLIDLYQLVDRLIDRFQALLDEVSRILVKYGGRDLFFPRHATLEERHEVTIANRKLLAIARDMRDISESIQELLPEKSEFAKHLYLISQICTTISEVEGNVCLKFGFPPEIPANSQLPKYDEEGWRGFHWRIPGMQMYGNWVWSAQDDANVQALDEYRRELRSAIAVAMSDANGN